MKQPILADDILLAITDATQKVYKAAYDQGFLAGDRAGYARGFAAATEHATKLAEALQR